MKTFTSFFLTLVALVAAQLPVDETEQCACPFLEAREIDCYIYGPNPSGAAGLVAYPSVDEPCITSLGLLDDRYIPHPYDFWRMCPHPNATGHNVDEIVQMMQAFPESEASQLVMSVFGRDMPFELFAFSNETGLWAVTEELRDNQQGGQPIDCQEKPFACWNKIKPQMTNRDPRYDIICGKWHEIAVPGYYDEQGKAREAICLGNYNETAEKFCEPLIDAITTNSGCSVMTEWVDASASGVPLCSDPPPEMDSAYVVSAWGSLILALIGFTWW